MAKYLGEVEVPIQATPFAKWSPGDWAVHFALRHGQHDGDEHKAWAIDQMVRVLLGTPVIVKKARWSDGTEEWRTDLGKPSKLYRNTIQDFEYPDGPDAEQVYEYHRGIAP